MKKTSIWALTLTLIATAPFACTIKEASDEDSGGSNAGGQAGDGGSESKGGSTAKGGSSAKAGSSAKGGETSQGGSSAATGGTAAVGGTSAQGGSTSTSTVVRTVIEVDADITAPTTWTADHIYVLPSNATIDVSSTLTIQAGTIVKVKSGGYLAVSSTGTLLATGTATDHVTFTSIQDDVGGDTNGDGSATTTNPAPWRGVFVDGSGSSFTYIDYRYSTDGLELRGTNQSVTYSTFVSNDVALDAAGVDDPTKTTIQNNTFYGNQEPLVIAGGIAIDATNVFHNPADATKKNSFQSIRVTSDISNSVTWSNTEVAYAFAGTNATFDVTTSKVLTLAAGVAIKFGSGSSFSVAAGASIAGRDGATFTAYNDDTVLGDSDNTANSTATAAYWRGIYDSDTGAWLTGANIKFAESH
jgi:hypothetical protein